MTRLLTAILAVAVLAVGGFLFLGPRGLSALPENPLIGAANAQSDTVDATSVVEMTLGDENAPLTVIEYASFTCPHCRNFHEGPFKKLKAEYIDTGKVRFVYRDVYFDRYGLWAALVARCEPAKFFGITDMIYKGQADWTKAGGPAEIVEELRKYGRLAGIPDDRLDACLSDAEKAQTLVAWYQENATRDGVEGTPSFVVNGTKVDNQAWDSFKAILDAELAK